MSNSSDRNQNCSLSNQINNSICLTQFLNFYLSYDSSSINIKICNEEVLFIQSQYFFYRSSKEGITNFQKLFVKKQLPTCISIQCQRGTMFRLNPVLPGLIPVRQTLRGETGEHLNHLKLCWECARNLIFGTKTQEHIIALENVAIRDQPPTFPLTSIFLGKQLFQNNPILIAFNFYRIMDC